MESAEPSGVRNYRRYTGKDLDPETDLTYMAARYYMHVIGRFLTRDPEHTTMSPYAYCVNNPVSLIDPTGHSYGGGTAQYNAPMHYTFTGQDRLRVINLTYTSVSGKSREEIHLEMEAYAAYIRGKHLWSALERAFTNVIPSGAQVAWRTPGEFNAFFKGTADYMISDEKFKAFMEALKTIAFQAHSIEGTLTTKVMRYVFDFTKVGGYEYRATEQKDVTLADLLWGLVREGPIVLATFFTKDPDLFGASIKRDDYTLILFRKDFADNLKGFTPQNDLGEVTNRGLMWHTFLHETLHVNSDAYTGDKYSPENDINPFIRIRHPDWY